MTQTQDREIYAYIPSNPGDSVYEEDLGIAVVLLTGPADIASKMDAIIRAAITKDPIANERVLRNLIVAAGEATFEDLDTKSETPYSKELHKTLSDMSSSNPGNVTWSTLDEKDDLFDMKITRATKIRYEYLHLGGMGYSMI